MKTTRLHRLALAAGLLALLPTVAPAVNLVADYSGEEAGVGFNNATNGAQRQAAFQYCLDLWGDQLQGPNNVTITVRAEFATGLPSGVLAFAGPDTFYSNFSGAPLINTWYANTLREALTGSDPNGGTFDVDVTINETPGAGGWFFGIPPANPGGSQFDLVTVLLHEVGHGLNFLDLISESTGAWGGGTPDVYGRHLNRLGGSPSDFEAMSNAQRLAALTSSQVYFDGTRENAYYGTTNDIRIYAPNPYEGGSSISHFNLGSFSPFQLMEPAVGTGVSNRMHDVGYAMEVFVDLGYTQASDTDNLPDVSFQQGANARLVPMNEGDSIQVPIVLGAPAGVNATVNYTVSGTGITAGDYTLTPASPVTITAGQYGTNLTLTANTDATAEGVETLLIQLSSPTNATLLTANNWHRFQAQITNVAPSNPTVTVNQAVGQLDPDNASPSNFTVVFSEAVSDFTNGDVTLGGTATGKSAVVTGSGTTYNVAVSATGDGTIIPSLAAGVATGDVSAATNLASSSTDNSVTLDTTSPGIVGNVLSGPSGTQMAFPIQVMVTFTEPVSDFGAEDVDLSASTATPVSVSGVSPGSRAPFAGPFTITINGTGMTTSGNIVVDIDGADVFDAAGNALNASGLTPFVIDYDNGLTGAGTWEAYE